MAGIQTKVAALVKTAITEAKPKLHVFRQYAAVELTPPKISDIPAIRSGFKNLISSARSGKYRELTVREAWLNTLVAVEIACWFFVGECIGKRHLIGYKV